MSTRGNRIAALAVIAALGAGCSGGSSAPSSTTGGATDTSRAAAGPVGERLAETGTVTSDAEASRAPRPTVLVPPGVQFGDPVQLPRGFIAGSAEPAADGTTTVWVGQRRDTVGRLSAAAAISSNSASWELVSLDSIDFAVPGFDSLTFVAKDVSHGDGGFVAIGSSAGRKGDGIAGTGVDVLWHSADGRSWQLIDVRPLLGGGSQAIKLSAVTWAGDRYLAVGAVASTDLATGPSRGLVLWSADGTTWSVGAEVALPFSTEIDGVAAVGDSVLFHGTEYVCTSDARALTTFATGGQLRLWRSDDGGVALSPIALPTGVVDPAEATPSDPAACPPADQPDLLAATNERLGAMGGGVLVAAGYAVVLSADVATAAVSDDLSRWRLVPVPGALPAAPDDAVTARVPVTMVDHDGRAVLVAAGPRRDPQDRAVKASDVVQTIAWTLAPDGSTWHRQPTGRPVLAGSVARIAPWGRDVAMVGADAAGGPGWVWRSTAGTLEHWEACDPAPEADCAFAEISGMVAGGLDLAGIDLTGVVGTNADLTGANLTGASLRFADVAGLRLTGADLSGADLSHASMADVDLSGAALDDADLTGAALDASFFVAQSNDGANLTDALIALEGGDDLSTTDFTGWLLRGTSFSGDSAVPVPLVEADFTGVDLTGARFTGVDLTGATFAGATLESVSFTDVLCPDGQPAIEDVVGPQSCRL